jgi:rRNA maturation protein Nop10
MAQVQAQRMCKVCGKKTLHAKPVMGDGFGCLLTLLTCGLFLLIWIPMKFCEAVSRYTCQTCGSKSM